MYKILGWKSVRDCLPLEPSWWWGRGTKPIQRGWEASYRKHRNTDMLWYNTLQGRMVFSWYKLASHCWETGKPIKNNKGREATVLFSMVSQTQTLSDWLPQLQQLQVTDGNYTVAWLVADEDDGAGYYEDDDDDQVKHGAHQHYDSLDLLAYFLFMNDPLASKSYVQTTFGACDHYLDRSVSIFFFLSWLLLMLR